MQNVIYAVIGVILTVAAMYMVSPSISASSEAIQAGMISTEVGAIKNASKMWLANSSSDGTFAAITEADISTLVPDLEQADGNTTLLSKTSGVKHTIAGGTTTNTNDSIVVVITGMTSQAQTDIVDKNVLKFGTVSGKTASGLTVTIKG